VSLDLAVRLERGGFSLDVAVSAQHGEVLAVLGPNGAGKSTLLGLLSGLLRPDSGYVRVGDRTVTDVERGIFVPAHRRGVGLLAQEPLLFPHMTALANVAFGPRAQGVSKRSAEIRALALLDDVLPDVPGLADRRPAQLSGGQQQRVALARAIAPRPELLLLDEPLAALDIDAAPAMRALLRRVIRGGGRPRGLHPGDGKRTAVLVTHSALDALVLADRVVVLGHGRVVEQGPTREVLGRPRSAFAARIAGLDLIPGIWRDGALRAGERAVEGLAAEVAEGDSAVAVFPPSAVAVFREEPHGSPRNVLPVRLASIEPRGDIVRLRAAPRPGGPEWLGGLAADVTPAAVADLAVEPGADLWFSVKATEVAVHPAGAPSGSPKPSPRDSPP
jgi:molybdate transport system ATP-binding protein